MGFLNPLYNAVAWLLVHIHTGLAHVVGSSAAWSLSIVVLTVAMRLLLFPVFVKQIRSQRAMQAVQPKMKELQTKYKNDKEKLNQEMMALWREAGVNPLSGCLPLVLQIPIFISLFHTLKEIKPISTACNSAAKCYKGQKGFPQVDVFHAAHAKLFGIVPISASFKTSSAVLHALGGSVSSTRALCLILTIIMGATTFITQRQLMARNGPAADSQQAQTQKIMLYVFPVFFLAYGFFFPVGVLLYWLTTNIWSMVQQYVVIHRMDAAPVGGPTVTPSGPRPGAKPNQPPRGGARPASPASDTPAVGPAPGAKPNRSTGDVVLPPGGAISGAMPGPRATPPAGNPKPPTRPSANRSNKRKRRGR
ncbi:MAG TPA: membrane protein insertase YidC [Mycobacteriales bacterium]|jgi:YidC/Oxa1 family membrane protein insertase|nr:membrane protein insertase YidC [Mycobacteriales bacterium]